MKKRNRKKGESEGDGGEMKRRKTKKKEKDDGMSVALPFSPSHRGVGWSSTSLDSHSLALCPIPHRALTEASSVGMCMQK